jgi:sulfonate transport system substrate-binding protein
MNNRETLGRGPVARRDGTLAAPRRMKMVTSAAVALVLASAASAPSAVAAPSATRSPSSARPSLSGVTLHIGDQAGDGSEALLQAAGLLDKLPFKAAWSDFTSGPPILQAEASGSIDVGGVGDAPPVFAASGGAKIAIIEALERDPNSAALVVPKGSPITSIDQLKGKTIAVAQGSSADFHLLTVLTKAGLTVHEVTLDYLQPAEALAALQAGKVDAWDTWTPYTEEAVYKFGARILVNGDGYGSNYSYEVASRAALDDAAKQAAIGVFLSTLNKAYAWEKTHSAAWATTWAADTGLPLSVMEVATKDELSTPVPVTASVIASEQSLVNAFYNAGLIPTKVNFAAYSYTGYNNLFTAK